MSKVTVVGAGAVGATCANVMACREVASEVVPVSYTHLDVYKRQARGLSTPLGRRKRAFLPRYHRGIVRDSPHRVQELRSYPFNAFRMESHGVAAHSGL